jgi:hypothetical protein
MEELLVKDEKIPPIIEKIIELDPEFKFDNITADMLQKQITLYNSLGNLELRDLKEQARLLGIATNLEKLKPFIKPGKKVVEIVKDETGKIIGFRTEINEEPPKEQSPQIEQ